MRSFHGEANLFAVNTLLIKANLLYAIGKPSLPEVYRHWWAVAVRPPRIFSASFERTLLLVRENQDQLRIIVQGVINALFAGRRIRCAPIVKKVVADGSDNFRIHLDDNQVSAISVTVEAEEFFAEAVRKAVLRRLASSRQIPGSYRH